MMLAIIVLALFAPTICFALASNSYCSTGTSTYTQGRGSCARDIFLQGSYIELGINNVASFGTTDQAPSTYAYSGQPLGFVADFDQNGWVGPNAYAGDYFLFGTELEGMH